jgi:hypothetical protein
VTNLNASKPQKVTLANLSAILSKLIEEKGADTFLGSLPTSQGLLVLLFSHRYNEDHALLIAGSETSRVLGKVHEILAGEDEAGL